jgi:hypothetical protein
LRHNSLQLSKSARQEYNRTTPACKANAERKESLLLYQSSEQPDSNVSAADLCDIMYKDARAVLWLRSIALFAKDLNTHLMPHSQISRNRVKINELHLLAQLRDRQI